MCSVPCHSPKAFDRETSICGVSSKYQVGGERAKVDPASDVYAGVPQGTGFDSLTLCQNKKRRCSEVESAFRIFVLQISGEGFIFSAEQRASLKNRC